MKPQPDTDFTLERFNEVYLLSAVSDKAKEWIKKYTEEHHERRAILSNGATVYAIAEVFLKIAVKSLESRGFKVEVSHVGRR